MRLSQRPTDAGWYDVRTANCDPQRAESLLSARKFVLHQLHA